MDVYLQAVKAHLRLCELSLEARLKLVEKTAIGRSRRQSRLDHTAAMLSYVQELQGMVTQDPDEWDEESALAPF